MTIEQYDAETDRLLALAESQPHPPCPKTGEPMLLQVFNSDEAEDNIECGIPGAQYACYCNGGHYAAIS